MKRRFLKVISKDALILTAFTRKNNPVEILILPNTWIRIIVDNKS